MIALRHLLNSIWPNYTKFELTFFNKLAKSLDNRTAKVLLSQVNEINFTQRHRRDKEICFYKIQNLMVSLSRYVKFDSTGEELLCECKIELSGTIVNAEIWLVKGNLFSIEFNREMIRYRDVADFELSIVC